MRTHPCQRRPCCLPAVLALGGAVALAAAAAPAPAAQRGSAEEEAAMRARWCREHPENCGGSLHVRYAARLREAIGDHWRVPRSLADDAVCVLDLRQKPGGRVESAELAEPCGFDPAGRRSLLDAVQAAAPLPYQGYEQVFRPQIRLTFRAAAEDEAPRRRWWRRWRDRDAED